MQEIISTEFKKDLAESDVAQKEIQKILKEQKQSLILSIAFLGVIGLIALLLSTYLCGISIESLFFSLIVLPLGFYALFLDEKFQKEKRKKSEYISYLKGNLCFVKEKTYFSAELYMTKVDFEGNKIYCYTLEAGYYNHRFIKYIDLPTMIEKNIKYEGIAGYYILKKKPESKNQDSDKADYLVLNSLEIGVEILALSIKEEHEDIFPLSENWIALIKKQ